MRKTNMALALVGVVAMTGVASAVSLTRVIPTAGFDVEGFESYTVLLGGKTTFGDINIEGTVVQSNRFDEDWNYDPPVWMPIATAWDVGMPAAHKAMDTHLLFPKPVVVLRETGIETNDAWGREEADRLVPTESRYMCGLGTFTSEHLAAFALPAILPPDSPFMQVVIPAGTQVHLTGKTAGGVIDQYIGVPEPGTLVLLVAGSLCLLVARSRK
jgi:hypothetical protein